MLFKLNDAQLNKLADITSDLDEFNFGAIVSGIVVTAFLWFLSLWILRNKNI